MFLLLDLAGRIVFATGVVAALDVDVGLESVDEIDGMRSAVDGHVIDASERGERFHAQLLVESGPPRTLVDEAVGGLNVDSATEFSKKRFLIVHRLTLLLEFSKSPV